MLPKPCVASAGHYRILAAGLIVLALTGPAQAQNAGATLWGRSGCADCHGYLAAGDGDPAYPAGPDLRRARLTRDQLIETIACGRPGTEMPFNLKGAYAQSACYGMPLAKAPAEVRDRGSLTAEQIETLADFLLEHVVGKTRITRDNCAIFNDGNRNAPACLQF